MEIGGYLELEHFKSRPYHKGVYELNLGRTALVYLLKALKCTTLFVPYFICDSVTEACRNAGFSLEYYHLDKNLAPCLARNPEENEYLYLVNYYGQLSDEQILAFKSHYDRIIVDHTHAFFQKPLKGVPTIYSLRKFFGVSDGAYLSCDLELEVPEITDQSHDRMGHLLGRFECPASDFYSVMLDNAEQFHHETVKQMSPLTRNILGAVDYEHVRRVRKANYLFLKERLDNDNIMNQSEPEGPFAYPIHTRNGASVRKELARRQIYIPTYWNNVINQMPADSVEYDLAANILPLPCDQRYGKWEMEHLADAVLAVLQQYGE